MIIKVSLQRDALLEVVNRVNGFAGLRTGQQGIAMRRAALQLVQLLTRLGRLMAEVLTPADCTVLASTLMEVHNFKASRYCYEKYDSIHFT